MKREEWLRRYRAQIHNRRPGITERDLYNLANIETYDDISGNHADEPERAANQEIDAWDREGR
jgi:hypothetical protein